MDHSKIINQTRLKNLPAGKGLTSWLSFVVSNCEFVIFPLVSWVQCGTWFDRFLILHLYLLLLVYKRLKICLMYFYISALFVYIWYVWTVKIALGEHNNKHDISSRVNKQNANMVHLVSRDQFLLRKACVFRCSYDKTTNMDFVPIFIKQRNIFTK